MSPESLAQLCISQDYLHALLLCWIRASHLYSPSNRINCLIQINQALRCFSGLAAEYVNKGWKGFNIRLIYEVSLNFQIDSFFRCIYTPMPFCADSALDTKFLRSAIVSTNQNLGLTSEEAVRSNFQLPACLHTCSHTWRLSPKFTQQCANYYLLEKAGHAKLRIMLSTIIDVRGIKQSDENFVCESFQRAGRNLQISMQIGN